MKRLEGAIEERGACAAVLVGQDLLSGQCEARNDVRDRHFFEGLGVRTRMWEWADILQAAAHSCALRAIYLEAELRMSSAAR